jgi:hypothetical protein
MSADRTIEPAIPPEDLVLMLNMGWSLQDIATLAKTDVRAVEQIIVAQVQRERRDAESFSQG